MKVAQSHPTLCNPMDYVVPGILQARILEWVAFPSPGDLPKPGTEPRSPALRADSLPAEPQGKPKNIGVGSLSLLQGTFLTQGSNPGILHCRWILYQLSYQGSPRGFHKRQQNSVQQTQAPLGWFTWSSVVSSAVAFQLSLLPPKETQQSTA